MSLLTVSRVAFKSVTVSLQKGEVCEVMFSELKC